MNGNKKVLIIEDDICFANELEKALLQSGISVDVAFNGREGIKKHLVAKYRIIITDMVMPVMDGIEVIMWTLENSPNVTLIAISESDLYNSSGYLLLAKEFGAKYTFQKPFCFAEIIRAVKELLEGD